MFTFRVNSIIIKTVIFNCCSKLLRRNTKHLNTTATLQTLKNLENENSSVDIENIEDKVIYNSVIKHGRMVHGKPNTFSVAEEVQYKKEGSPVLALKYFTKEFCNERNLDCENNAGVGLTKEKNENIHFPYEKHHEVTINDLLESTSDTSTAIDVYEDVSSRELNRNLFFNEVKDNPTSKRPGRKWMKDYNKYAEVSVKITEEEDKEDYSWDVNYGSADPKVPASRVPCGGCGANLHCQDSAIPGYLPKEIFFGLEEKQLQTLVCQRCHFLQEYGTALSVRVDPEIYPQLLSQIKSKMALVILVVDMTDFPCSIWPGIIDIIGPKRPLVVVGNKIDLLQDFNKHWLTRAKEALRQQLPRKANVLHVTLVSAKTGYGIEDLITSLYNLWEYRGDVYLVGCTNVGKSSLFNALLQSDYCKTKAVDLIQRATTAPWPGTTLSLLKFPITRPEGWRLAERASRLRRQSAEDLRLIQERKTYITPQMISLIGRTFSHSNLGKFTDDYEEDPFALPKLSTLRLVRGLGEGLDPSDPVFANSRWFYDTPGVVTKDQIIDLLTTEELMLTLSQEPLIPRTLQVWPGQSLLVGGLARIDYISGPANIKMTVLAAMKLPVTLCWIRDADVVYQHYLGSAALAVPCGGKERLRLWPGLNAGTEFVLKGTGWKESCADIVLSSAGWVAVTAQQNTLCQLQAWTPQARGIHVRIPPVLPRAIALKGCKIHKTQAYALFNKDVKKFK